MSSNLNRLVYLYSVTELLQYVPIVLMSVFLSIISRICLDMFIRLVFWQTASRKIHRKRICVMFVHACVHICVSAYHSTDTHQVDNYMNKAENVLENEISLQIFKQIYLQRIGIYTEVQKEIHLTRCLRYNEDLLLCVFRLSVWMSALRYK